jgi:hypothetical protein
MEQLYLTIPIEDDDIEGENDFVTSVEDEDDCEEFPDEDEEEENEDE